MKKNRMMKSLKYYIKAIEHKSINYAMLCKSQKVNRHIVVFESDDWGSIRMPSLEVLNSLRNMEFKSIYDFVFSKYDTLASNNDLERLMDVLLSVKDSNGNPAKITLNCVVANPDFDKIEKNGFREYFYEPFTETLKRYPNHDRAFDLWKEGMKNKLFKPQFHGREHLNFQRWIKLLQMGSKKDVLECFNSKNYAMVDDDTCVLEAYNIELADERSLVERSIEEGLDLFEKLFGFRSLSMIAPCYRWDDYVEDCAFRNGVKYIQGTFIQKYSNCHKRISGKSIRGHFLGEKNHNGQVYLTRNCYFEPSQNKLLNADNCLKQIDKMFEMKLPAIISCHRLNFIGDLSEKNRENNLKCFQNMLKILVKKYPDLEFLSSDEVFEI